MRTLRVQIGVAFVVLLASCVLASSSVLTDDVKNDSLLSVEEHAWEFKADSGGCTPLTVWENYDKDRYVRVLQLA